jgi:hypothetical protein
VVEQTEAWGHAVRAGYMYAGMADVAALTGDSSYIKAIDKITENIISKKYYITGGVGARHEGEAFGADYELPNLTAYNETCAAISMVYLFQRMFLLHGDAKYIDCLERTLYNGVISGMSIDGGRFFYPNPLSADGEYKFNADNTNTRQPWFGCACCPSNLCRFIPSFPGYMYAVKDQRVFVNLFAGNTATIQVAGKDVVLEQQTNYPWDGDIAIKVLKNKGKAFDLAIRIPGWLKEPVPSDLYHFANGGVDSYELRVNGEAVSGKLQQGYMVVNRKWKKGDVVTLHLPMTIRTVAANKKLAADRGRMAVERGPLVYCAEAADNQFDIFSFVLSDQPQYEVEPTPNAQHPSPNMITARGQVVSRQADGKLQLQDTRIKLIPYYAWNHRGVGKMDVWLLSDLSKIGR